MWKSVSRMVCTVKWKNFAAAYGSAAIVCALSALDGPDSAANLSRSIEAPAKTCATGSWMSLGLMVTQSDGGPCRRHVDHICPRILYRDASEP